jgi:hypothetical protein
MRQQRVAMQHRQEVHLRRNAAYFLGKSRAKFRHASNRRALSGPPPGTSSRDDHCEEVPKWNNPA